MKNDNQTPTDHARELEQAAKEECFEFNGCFTGDCPHSSVQDCGTHFFKVGADWVLQSKLVREMTTALTEIAIYNEHLDGTVAFSMRQFARDALTAYRAAVGEGE